ncbi:hypothetical protein J2S09_004102 [Bacillus fengqiuensis]|nr:hypothetical protein [Bacillus fengqiuensis]
MNIVTMTKSYRMLYEIEITLRDIADSKMGKRYGPIWRRKLGEEGKDYLHDTIALFGKYGELINIFSLIERKKLHSLVSIRNKICHMTLIIPYEYDLLKQCHELVTKKISSTIASAYLY